MTRENAQDKAHRLLTSARLIVTSVNPAARTVEALTRGEGFMHAQRYDPLTGWRCSCPARTERCAHLLALRAVVAVDLEPAS